jgi:hypothetical protein
MFIATRPSGAVKLRRSGMFAGGRTGRRLYAAPMELEVKRRTLLTINMALLRSLRLATIAIPSFPEPSVSAISS